MDRVGERVEADEQEERVHGHLHDAQRGRAPEEDECAMNERMEKEKQREQEKGGLGERREREREEDEDLEDGGESVRADEVPSVRPAVSTPLFDVTHLAVLDTACQRSQGAMAEGYRLWARREGETTSPPEWTPTMAYVQEEARAATLCANSTRVARGGLAYPPLSAGRNLSAAMDPQARNRSRLLLPRRVSPLCIAEPFFLSRNS